MYKEHSKCSCNPTMPISRFCGAPLNGQQNNAAIDALLGYLYNYPRVKGTESFFAKLTQNSLLYLGKKEYHKLILTGPRET